MIKLNMKRTLPGDVAAMIPRVEAGLKEVGFGVLTRIDFHSKIKEKLNQDLPPTVILGACNPALAYQAFLKNTDVTSLIPCNVTVREVGAGTVSIEVTKPSAMMEMMGETELAKLACEADAALEKMLAGL
jgi:uncharacterized protein (DUF302 family)